MSLSWGSCLQIRICHHNLTLKHFLIYFITVEVHVLGWFSKLLVSGGLKLSWIYKGAVIQLASWVRHNTAQCVDTHKQRFTKKWQTLIRTFLLNPSPLQESVDGTDYKYGLKVVILNWDVHSITRNKEMSSPSHGTTNVANVQTMSVMSNNYLHLQAVAKIANDSITDIYLPRICPQCSTTSSSCHVVPRRDDTCVTVASCVGTWYYSSGQAKASVLTTVDSLVTQYIDVCKHFRFCF